MNEYTITALIIASAICGGFVVYYYLKQEIDNVRGSKEFWQKEAKEKTFYFNEAEADVDLWKERWLEQKVEFDKLEQQNNGQIEYTHKLIKQVESLESELNVAQKKTDLYIQISLDQKVELDKLKTNKKKIKFTDQQNKEILRLRKRGYSFDKIAETIGYSDETIRKQYHYLTKVN